MKCFLLDTDHLKSKGHFRINTSVRQCQTIHVNVIHDIYFHIYVNPCTSLSSLVRRWLKFMVHAQTQYIIVSAHVARLTHMRISPYIETPDRILFITMLMLFSLVYLSLNVVPMGSGVVLSLLGTKPSPEPILTYGELDTEVKSIHGNPKLQLQIQAQGYF